MTVAQFKLEFGVLGPAVGAARPRVTSRGTYMPVAHRRWALAWQQAAELALRSQAWLAEPAPLAELYVSVWRRRPQRLRSRVHRIAGSPLELAAVKPDLDNVIKLVMDGITQARRVWTDDAAVAAVSAVRHWLPIDGEGNDVGAERTEVIVYGYPYLY